MSDPEIRSPLIEGLADFGQGLLTSNARALYMREIAALRGVFQNSLNYNPIRVADTSVGAAGRPYTLGNTVRIPGGGAINIRTLVHECTHVWQYQTQGTRYISNSAYHQIMDSSAYNVVIVPRKAFSAYSAENQAVIVEAYYVDTQRPVVAPLPGAAPAPVTATTYDPSVSADPPIGWSRLPDVVNCIRTLRAALPMTDLERYQERLGPTNPFPAVPGTSDRELAPIVPLFRVDF